jgi:SAM-dependent methyltransferase
VRVPILVCSVMTKALRIKFFGKSPVGAYLRLNQWLWNRLPPSLTAHHPLHLYGIFLHALARLHAQRRQFFGTFFLRNRPELELICRLLGRKEVGSDLKIAVLGCSDGAEVYSILWTIRSSRPDLRVVMHGVDISKEVLELAQEGVYSLTAPALVDQPILERMTGEEMREMFDRREDHVRIKSWIKEGVIWHVGAAEDPEIMNVLGTQDMVMANNFLCHMDAPDAERCLRNIGRLVSPGGYLFVSGIDLDVRTKVARDLNWEPVLDLIEDIHNGDYSLRADWPCKWWGLEPLDKRRHDWEVRYASVFQLGKMI